MGRNDRRGAAAALAEHPSCLKSLGSGRIQWLPSFPGTSAHSRQSTMTRDSVNESGELGAAGLAHATNQAEQAGGGIIEFSRAIAAAAGDEHSAIRQQGRGVERTRYRHTTGQAEGASRRIVESSARQDLIARDRRNVRPTCDQHLAVPQQRSGVPGMDSTSKATAGLSAMRPVPSRLEGECSVILQDDATSPSRGREEQIASAYQPMRTSN